MIDSLIRRNPSLPYVVPFGVFMALLGLAPYVAFLGRWESLFRIAVLMAVLWLFSRDVISFRVSNAVASVGLGLAVFAIWIGPDLLIPGYRDHWWFQNGIMGKLQSSISEELRADRMVLGLRFFRAAVLVPIIEELFWRAWMMRWIISPDFQSVKLGTYTSKAMWISALLFASEHGSYWEVGLAAGLIYNWWMVRTKSLGDCILAHAVTNAALSIYVLQTGKWEYWL
ncbi:MAG: CAAX prenyl protease-related protein [Bryobacteraceae bacterium]